MADEGDLPPLVSLVQANIDDLLTKLDAAEARITSLTDKLYVAKLLANDTAANATIDDAIGHLGDWSKMVGTATATLDAAQANAQFDEIDARLATWSSMRVGPTIELGGVAETNARIAQVTAELRALGAVTARPNISTGASGAAGAATSTVLASLLRGGGGSGGLFGLPSIGSIGSFAGLGLEHFLTTGLGLAGSAVGGVAGAGLLGAGALGVGAVGMGTDLAGTGQAAGDIKAVTTAQTALNTAVQEYGTNSSQAQAAQAAYNQSLASFNPIAKDAVQHTSELVEGFKTLFDQSTGAAEKTGAQIIGDLVSTADQFLPTIGKFAAQNASIIQSSLQPLLTWITGPGAQIFDQLEQKFQSDLPTAMDAFDQGVELLVRTIGYIAPETGTLTDHLDALFTRLNSTDGFDHWTTEVQKLIDDFHDWDTFLKLLGGDLDLVFKNDAGTASAILNDLDGMLTKLHNYLETTTGQSNLQNIFTVHRQEIEALLNMLPSLLGGFSKIEFTIGPPLVTLVTDLANAATAVVNLMQKLGPLGQVFDAGLGLTLILGKLGLLKTALSVAGPLFTAMGDAALGSIPGLSGAAAAMGAEEGGVAAEAGLASTAVGGLLTNLAALGAIGTVAVGIDVIWNLTNAVNKSTPSNDSTLGNERGLDYNPIHDVAQAWDILFNEKNVKLGSSAPTPQFPQSGVGVWANPGAAGQYGLGRYRPPQIEDTYKAPYQAPTTAPPGGVSTPQQTAAQTAATTAFTALNKSLTAVHTSGLKDLNALLTATHSGSLTSLNTALDSEHKGALAKMVTELKTAHASALSQLSSATTAAQRAAIEKDLSNNKELSNKILTAVKDAEQQRTYEIAAIEQAQSAARVASTVAANNTMTQDWATAAANVSNAATTLANDAAKLASDQSAGSTTGIGDAAAVATANSTAQVQAIQDQSQIITDTAAEAGLTGAALAAQQAIVALDIQKQTDDAKINADQVALAVQKQTDDANIAAATAHEDQVAIIQDGLVSRAQSALDTATIVDQGKVNGATIANTIAEAGTNVKQQASTTAALNQALQDQSTDLADLGSKLTAAQSAQTSANAGAQNALQAIQSTAANLEALLAAQLSNDQGDAAVTEAKLAAIVQQLNQAASAATAAATTSTTTVNVTATVVTQIDGQTVALITTPLIRQELLRTTGRQTQNIYGGSAGRPLPAGA